MAHPRRISHQRPHFEPPALALGVDCIVVTMERPAPLRRRGLCCESEDKQYRATSERSRSMKRIKFVGLDVHADTIAVVVVEQDGEVRSLGVIANRFESIRKLVKKLGPVEELYFCYEAGPTGYVLYWQLT